MADLDFPIQQVPIPGPLGQPQVSGTPVADVSDIILNFIQLKQNREEMRSKRIHELSNTIFNFAQLYEAKKAKQSKETGAEAQLDLLLKQQKLEGIPLETRLKEARVGALEAATAELAGGGKVEKLSPETLQRKSLFDEGKDLIPLMKSLVLDEQGQLNRKTIIQALTIDRKSVV